MMRKRSLKLLISCIFISVIGVTYAAIQAYTKNIKVDFENVRKQAEVLSHKAYQPASSSVPKKLLDFTYDQHRDIRFTPDKAIWKDQDLPFNLQFFHPGFIFNKPINVYETDSRSTARIPFSKSLFNYGKNDVSKITIPETMGFSGFRIHYPLNKSEYFDELTVFQGASYFRVLAKGLHYGISARGLAINSGGPESEEFPIFTDFWIEKPKPNDSTITLYALLNSPSVAGAYQFIIHPGEKTEVDVKLSLFFRNSVDVLGVAPLTSMFWYGENSENRPVDFRPEVHDSDGILMQTGSGEWLWRPLVNDSKMRAASFEDTNPKGFGLFQMDRNFDHYSDLEAFYHMRPSVWIQPIGDWGKGHIRLIELPTADETNDNIVSYWIPDKKTQKGDVLNLQYKMTWLGDAPQWPPAGKPISTRWSAIPKKSREKRVIIDWSGEKLNSLGADHMLDALTSIQGGAIITEKVLQKNPIDGTWRLMLRLKFDEVRSPVELRCFLKEGNDILTTTWTYLLNP